MNNNYLNALDYIYQDIRDLKDEMRSIRALIEERLPDPETTGISVWEMASKIEKLEQKIKELEKLLEDPNS